MTAFDQFTNAMDERGANHVCPVCTNDEWIGLGEANQAQRVVIAAVEGNTVLPDEGFTFLGMYCANCGFLRLHKPETLGL